MMTMLLFLVGPLKKEPKANGCLGDCDVGMSWWWLD